MARARLVSPPPERKIRVDRESDRALARAVAAGESAADDAWVKFLAWVEGAVRAVCRRSMLDAQEAADICQDVLAHFLRRKATLFGRFRGNAALRTFVSAHARWAAVRRLHETEERRARERLAETSELCRRCARQATDASPPPLDEEVRRRLRSLPSRERRVLELRARSCLSWCAIGHEVGLSGPGAWRCYRRTILKLKAECLPEARHRRPNPPAPPSKSARRRNADPPN